MKNYILIFLETSQYCLAKLDLEMKDLVNPSSFSILSFCLKLKGLSKNTELSLFICSKLLIL